MDSKAFEKSNKIGKVGESAFANYVSRSGEWAMNWEVTFEAPDAYFPDYDFETYSQLTGMTHTHEIKTANDSGHRLAIQTHEYKNGEWQLSGALNPKCSADYYWIFKTNEKAFYVAGREALCDWIEENWTWLSRQSYECGSEESGKTMCLFLDAKDWPFGRIRPNLGGVVL